MSYTEIEISKMIKDAVKTALQSQKEDHDEAMQKLVDEHKAAHSPLSGTNLTKTSGISYNSMGTRALGGVVTACPTTTIYYFTSKAPVYNSVGCRC